MNRIRENLNYIIDEADSDKIKFEKIYKKMQDNRINISLLQINIENSNEIFTKGTVELEIVDKKLNFPFIVETLKFNSNLHNIILNIKKIIIFEELGIIPTATATDVTSSAANATPKQKNLIKDKFKIEEFKNLIDKKLQEFNINNIEELSKEQASKIIDCFKR